MHICSCSSCSFTGPESGIAGTSGADPADVSTGDRVRDIDEGKGAETDASACKVGVLPGYWGNASLPVVRETRDDTEGGVSGMPSTSTCSMCSLLSKEAACAGEWRGVKRALPAQG